MTLCGSACCSFHTCFPALTKNSDWVDQFRVKFLGSVQVPYHKGNDVLCAAMQKVAAPLGRAPTPALSPSLSWGEGRLPDVLSCTHRSPPPAGSPCTLTRPPAAS